MKTEDKKKDAKAVLTFDGKSYDFPTISDSLGARAIDIRTLRKDTGAVMFDPGFGNTATCDSEICYVDGEKGILRYRGYNIEDLVEYCDFVEVCYLLIKGELPNAKERDMLRDQLNRHSLLHLNMRTFFSSYPKGSHPMAILSSMVSSLSAFYPETEEDPELDINKTVARLLSKMRTIVAFTYRQIEGQDWVNADYRYSYCENLLNMMFSSTVRPYEIKPINVKALNELLILHADHEQNCSTSAVRLVASSGANLYASITAGVTALWGPRHGGANQEVMENLERIHREGLKIKDVIAEAKSPNGRLPGFGHRIYKTYDPRAKVAKKLCMEVLKENNISDPLLDIAMELEEAVLKDDYFKERNLYPNVDFYTGIVFRTLGIPTEMFTCMFALGRLPGWIAHWLEWTHDPMMRISRPRQLYTGIPYRKFDGKLYQKTHEQE